ncbi:MAG TPA: acyl-CoA dehydratase activase-related protein, partial [Spirochaetia bacterium]|nr:acyl-CoA dehydratase activase-related protein [Spirochaetia bacterium]
ILEIGGQDAKYTYLVNGVPCDYAMNEACSAGTGSFLEEAARESLDVDYRDIEGIAMTAQAPPNFNDQCAAFIASDIKSAAHERVSRADIVAGLVYSICMNYTNRVMGSRRIGNRVLMQGGVCYNRAVPLAMAALLQRPIVVPPDPGLMGAFGVALEIVHRMSLGLLARCRYDLRRLQDREVTHGRTFRCAGGSEKCDRGCTVNTLRIDGKTFPFGGACNRYYELRRRAGAAVGRNLVQARQDLLFASVPSSPPSADDGPTIGINRSFYMHTLYPLFSSFFSGLGLQVISSNGIDPAGASSVSSSFCFPTEIAHGAFANLLSLGPDYLFLPQIQEQFVENSGTTEPESHCSCVIGQAEPYYLRSVFRDIRSRIVSPVLNFSTGWSALVPQMASVATQVGATMAEGLAAAELAVEHQLEFGRARKEIGDRLLGELDRPDAPIAVVLFGRAYNAFPGEANLGIPQKFASRGVSVVPFDCLPTKAEESIDGMSWASGHEIIKAARFVKGHPRLFGCYITNFSCGPDSFLVGYFRDIMKTKPSLTLELDSHSADAGINTRVEAFLDIIERSVRIGVRDSHREPFVPARVEPGKRGFQFVCSDGKRVPLSVAEILIPSMGDITSRLGASALRGMGFSARHAPIPDFPVLMTGRKNTSCKECLPMILTTGTLLTELKDRPGSSPLVYFMPAQGGNCRFSQYTVFLQKLIAEKRLANVALWSLNSNNGYGGLSVPALLSILRSIIVSDCLDDIKNAVLALARDREKGMTVFEEALSRISRCMERGSRGLMRTLRGVARMLSSIELTGPLHQARTVLVAGEIYIRKDNFSSDVLVERLARRGIVCRRAPITEWLAYVDYYAQHLIRSGMSLSERVYLVGKKLIQARMERRIKKALAASGLCENEPVDIPALIRVGRRFVREELTGEIILVIGAFFREMIDHIHGLVSIGPFACLPSRVIESILSVESNVRNNERLKSLETYDAIRRFSSLPFLAVECDGNPFPPIIETRIEAFALQVERVHAQARESQDGRHRS